MAINQMQIILGVNLKLINIEDSVLKLLRFIALGFPKKKQKEKNN